MSRSSARGYVEPLAALAAVFAVTVGLAVYVGALDRPLRPTDRPVAETVLDELTTEAGTMGVVDVEAFASASPPAGWHANVTLATRDGRLSRGPIPPADADRATRRVSVRLAPGTIRPGRLTVVAWR